MPNQIKYINPEGLFKSPAFSQAVSTEGTGKTIYIGGQNAVNQKGEIVGKGDLKAQTEQAMQNVQTILEACGGSFKNIVRLTIHLIHGQDVRAGFEAAQKFMPSGPDQPAVTVLMVPGFANPDYLLEIDGIAFIPAND